MSASKYFPWLHIIIPEWVDLVRTDNNLQYQENRHDSRPKNY